MCFSPTKASQIGRTVGARPSCFIHLEVGKTGITIGFLWRGHDGKSWQSTEEGTITYFSNKDTVNVEFDVRAIRDDQQGIFLPCGSNGRTPLFQETSEAYFKNPGRMLKSLEGKDEPLGFGVVEIGSAILVSPIVLAIVDEATRTLTKEVTESGFAKQLVKKLFHRSEERKSPPPRLTQEQMEQVRKQAFESARQFKLPESQAALLADALIGRLALAQQ